MLKICKIYTLIALFLGLASPSFATTYYSSTGGSGSTCSTGSRCTIATGIGKLSGGDTLVLGDGTYDYQIHSVQPPSGSIGAPTVIVAEHALMAIIKPTTVVGGGFGLIDIYQKSYITFDGIIQDGGTADHENNDGFRLDSDDHIIIKNSEIRFNQFVDTMIAGNCASSPNGIEVTRTSGAHGSTFDQFLNNNVHDNGAFCADGEWEGLGYYIQESDNIIDGNTLTVNAEAAVQFRNGSGVVGAGLRNILRNSTLNGNIRVGVFVAEFTSGTQIYNNTITNTTIGYGIDFYANPSTSSVLNNTFYGNANGCILMDTGGASTQSGNTVKNNICYMDAGVAITQAIGGGAITGLTCSNNLNVSVCGPTEGVNNPKFVSSGTGNFHLQAGSPATGAGVNLCSTFCTDADGAARPAMGAWDAGAFILGSVIFYTSSTGSDTANNCQTLANPCNLANGFANEMAQIVAGRGDILYMCAGACDGAGSASVTTNFDGQSGYTIPSGSAYSNALTVQPYPGETITLLGFGCFCDHENYVILQGFKFDGTGLSSGNQAVVLVNGPNAGHIELLNMETTAGAVARSGVIDGNSSTGGSLYINLHSHHNGNSNLYHGIYIENTDNSLIDGGEFNNNSGSGIQTYFGSSHPANCTVRNALVHDNATGMFAEGTNCQYYNNIVYNSVNGGIDSQFGAASGNLFANNTIYNWDTGATSQNCLIAVTGSVLFKNNICWGSATGANISGGTSTTNLCTSGCTVTSDPLFVNAAVGNFRLQFNSPAVRSATNLSSVFITDILGNVRPSVGNWDMGPYIGSPLTCNNTSIGQGWVCKTAVAASSTNNNSVTTPAINTTGADLVLCAEATDQSFVSPVCTDSKANTWHPLTKRTTTFGSIRISYCNNPCTVGASHTFTVSNVNSYPCVAIVALSGSRANPFDVENGAVVSSSTSVATGPVIAGLASSILISGILVDDASALSINSSFNIIATSQGSGSSFGCSLAYLTQGSPITTNPTWNLNVAQEAAAAIATFKPLATVTKFRKTLSTIGGKVGKRQPQRD